MILSWSIHLVHINYQDGGDGIVDSPNDENRSLIDNIMVKKQFQSRVNINKTGSFPGEDAGGDYGLVMMSHALRLTKNRKHRSFNRCLPSKSR
ncbi:hypothetical protein PoB_002969100 [Plakobranchus ocellatus]|uniref:Uncharacterized protein n=1 Tax=Plakobranchus ocellatus TaxID=259542 RepID=A0AAV4A4N6_9GAST|nr:hypothetical protein PoB_002969100 [Plakobranchus ocellatus]